MKPYYEDKWVKIFHGDCREVLPQFNEVACPDCGSDNLSFNPLDNSDYICKECGNFYNGASKIDLLLTDPPYGIEMDKKKQHSSIRDNPQWKEMGWDKAPVSNKLLLSCVDIAKHSIIWGGNYYNLPVSSCWYIWNKVTRGFSMADGEMAWTSFDGAMRIFDLHRTAINGKEHPTQKPHELIAWCIIEADKHLKVATIIDPFLGSGTTCYCAKKLKRKSIGIEVSEKYCEIAARRCAQESFEFDLPPQSTEEQAGMSI